MTHPEPPKGCPFFEHSDLDGWLFVIKQRGPYKFGMRLTVASPAERYVAACVVMAWIRGELETRESAELCRSLQEWETYLDTARAEMEEPHG